MRGMTRYWAVLGATTDKGSGPRLDQLAVALSRAYSQAAQRARREYPAGEELLTSESAATALAELRAKQQGGAWAVVSIEVGHEVSHVLTIEAQVNIVRSPGVGEGTAPPPGWE